MLHENNIIAMNQARTTLVVGETPTCEPVHCFLQAFPSQGIGGTTVAHTYSMQSNNVILYTADEYFPYCMLCGYSQEGIGWCHPQSDKNCKQVYL